MINLGPLVFAAPWVLAALVTLPAIWWLLRVTPPAPRRLRFPAIRLLRDLVAPEQTPDRTPWWLLLLRLVLAALVIVALARPLLNPAAGLPGSGPVLLVVDNGWATARDWPSRRHAMTEIIDRAERQERPVVVLATAAAAPSEPPRPTGLLRPAEARGLADALTPRPWPSDLGGALAGLRDQRFTGSAYAVWLSDGLHDPGAGALAQRLQQFGSAEVRLPSPETTARVLRPPESGGADLVVRLRRVASGAEQHVWVRASAGDGRLLAREEAVFAAGSAGAEIRFAMPAAMRNEVTRLDIEGETTAGAVALLDERWRRRPVGIVTVEGGDPAQPLLSDLHYLNRALEPFTELRHGGLTGLIEGGAAVVLAPDAGTPSPAELAAIERWIAAGGVLVRFAGPLLAANPDPLVPVPLRFGDRVLSGTLSWTEPMPLAPFEAGSPFAGLAVPGDVRVRRQVLAEPSLALAERSWARLTDGTPLVTAERRGQGWLVLVHVTAGPEWSNLPMSGLFVDMLRRLVALSAGVPAAGVSAPLGPWQTLDGFGRLGTPPATARPLLPAAAGAPAGGGAPVISPEHPPGLYGGEDQRHALNLGAELPDPERLHGLPAGVAVAGYAGRAEVALMPWLLAAALVLGAADLVITLALRGLLGLPPRAGASSAGKGLWWRQRLTARSLRRTVPLLVLFAVLAGMWPGRPARADLPDDVAQRATDQTYLAYVVTGVPQVDEVSRAGLTHLAEVLRSRTAAEPAGAIGVDVAHDELAFFPLLYWPVVAEQADLPAAAIERLNAYLRNGGMILFDTREQAPGSAAALGGASAQRLRRLTQGLDIPPLAPVPPDHVLTRAFYLLQDFPGRYLGGDVWVEAAEERRNDGVSPVIIGGNDWAAAWASDDAGRPLFPVVPGGERQRELAFRFGVNVVMYALTGNYKSDQVHVPAILERLGQ